MQIKGFAPQHVVSQAGKVWLIGSSNPEFFTRCKIESVNPVTLSTHTYPLAACGSYITTGSGAIFLADVVYVRGSEKSSCTSSGSIPQPATPPSWHPLS